MHRIGLYINPRKDGCFTLARRIIGEIERGGANVALDRDSATVLERDELKVDGELAEKCREMIVLGGDGTMLRAVREAARHATPVLGINMGRLGFLTETEQKKADFAVRKLLDGDYEVERRTMLEAQADGGHVMYALNDAVVSRGLSLNMIQLDVNINGQSADSFMGDGIIVATPTGSTAYSLSCGGPLLSPTLSALVVTPICPHTLHARPIVVTDSDEILITPRAALDGELMLKTDGAESMPLISGQQVRIRLSGLSASFIRFDGNNFISLLRKKLNEWGGIDNDAS